MIIPSNKDKLSRIIISKRLGHHIKRFLPLLYSWAMYIHVAKREPEMILLPLFCDKDKISLDIGVLWGAYTYILRKLSKLCYAFEPNPEQISFLKRSFKRKVKIIPEALSDKSRKTILRVPFDIAGNATIEPQNRLAGRSYNEFVVNCGILDKYNLKDIAFIKIDVEGHEPSVLRGMEKTIEREKPTLFIEISSKHNPNSFSFTIDWMISKDYLIFYFYNGLLHNQIEFKDMLDESNEVKHSSNFIFIHKSKINRYGDYIK